MSYKVVDKVFKSRIGLKGTTKYVLAAMATRANDDGSQVYPSISELAADCGITRDTVYESIDKLIALGVLIDTDKKQFWGRGHYTCVYQINVPALSTRSTVSGSPTVSPTLTQQALDSVESSDATLSAQVRDPVQSKVSKEVRKGVSLRSTPVDVRVTKSKTNGNGSLRYDLDELRNQGWIDLILSLLPVFTIPSTPEPNPEIDAVLWLRSNGWTPQDIASLWDWNRAHKRGSKLEFFSLAQVVKAVQSDSTKSILAQWHKCQDYPCKKCPPPTPPPPSQGAAFFRVETLDDDAPKYMAGIDDEVVTSAEDGQHARQAFEIEEDLN
jgi:hypothetical protein